MEEPRGEVRVIMYGLSFLGSVNVAMYGLYGDDVSGAMCGASCLRAR